MGAGSASPVVSTTRRSRPISPNSLMITAVSASSGRRSSLFSSVVLPLPKKPVSTVTGMRCSAAVCVSLMKTLDPSCGAGLPEALGLPELLPRPLELAAATLVAGFRLLGDTLQRLLHVLRGTRRRSEVGQHVAADRAVV